ncbi:MAG TPA: hypothetical protein VIY90_12115 [Steroidobacteraceae bacterium]
MFIRRLTAAPARQITYAVGYIAVLPAAAMFVVGFVLIAVCMPILRSALRTRSQFRRIRWVAPVIVTGTLLAALGARLLTVFFSGH